MKSHTEIQTAKRDAANKQYAKTVAPAKKTKPAKPAAPVAPENTENPETKTA